MTDFKYLKAMQNITEDNLPNLKQVVLGALELFEKNKVSNLKFPNYKKPIVVGSGNAKITSRILYNKSEVIFSDENDFEQLINIKGIDGVVIFSASGSKHAPILAKIAKKKKIDITLITCTKNSPAQKIVGDKNTIITLKNPEPYTYNTSTYLGWILSNSKEDPKKIKDFILNEIEPKLPKNLGIYNAFLILTQNKFEFINELFTTKFIELFGRQISRDVKTFEEVKHAITVVQRKDELCIKFGSGDVYFSSDIINFKIPKWAGPATMMAIGYYVIGEIQIQKFPFFKLEINKYIKYLNKSNFGKDLNVIVK